MKSEFKLYWHRRNRNNVRQKQVVYFCLKPQPPQSLRYRLHVRVSYCQSTTVKPGCSRLKGQPRSADFQSALRIANQAARNPSNQCMPTQASGMLNLASSHRSLVLTLDSRPSPASVVLMQTLVFQPPSCRIVPNRAWHRSLETRNPKLETRASKLIYFFRRCITVSG